jgi:NADPH:quinone reductase-like Zn-dependent oxidoreductase
MKAFTLPRYDKKGTLQLTQMPEPVMNDNEVLVQVYAAGVNLLDVKIRNGEFKLILPYKFPLVLGHDVAGVVVKVGSKVSRFKTGDEIYARPADFRIGAFAEFIAIHENDVAVKPRDLSMEETASIYVEGARAKGKVVIKVR